MITPMASVGVDEFAFLPETAGEAGLVWSDAPRVERLGLLAYGSVPLARRLGIGMRQQRKVVRGIGVQIRGQTGSGEVRINEDSWRYGAQRGIGHDTSQRNRVPDGRRTSGLQRQRGRQ